MPTQVNVSISFQAESPDDARRIVDGWDASVIPVGSAVNVTTTDVLASGTVDGDGNIVPPGLPTPTLDSLDPDHAAVGDVTLVVHGTGFMAGAVIVFNDNDEVTQFVSDSEVSAVVGVSEPGNYPVAVRNPDGSLSPLASFTADEAPSA